MPMPSSPRPAFTHPLLPLTAAVSMVTATLHGGVTGAHFGEWVGYGVFFLTATILQFLFGAFLLLRSWETRAALADPFPRVNTAATPLEPLACAAGMVGNLLIILLYLLTRTVGIPFVGPAAGELEPWDLFGITTTLLEVGLVVLLARMRGSWLRENRRSTQSCG